MEDERVLIVCSVGTSAERNLPEGNLSKEEIEEKIEEAIEENSYKELNERLKESGKNGVSNTLKFIENGRAPESGFISAEIQSTFLFLKNNKNIKADIMLIHTEKSKFSALLNKFFLRQAGHDGFLKGRICDVKLEQVDMDVNSIDEFRKGLDDTFRSIEELTVCAEKRGAGYAEVYINPTGGYKSWAFYLLLYAFISGYSVFYIYEESNELLMLPSIPIQYAIGSMDEEISLLKYIKEKGSIDDEMVKGFPNWVKNLTVKEDDRYRPSQMLEKMVSMWEGRRKAISGFGEPFVKRLSNDAWKKWFLDRMSNEWAELWLGDQIPETVEHSLRHSKRLMEIVSNIYRAMDNQIEKDDGIFALLIASIYLHDIGHTAIMYPVNSGNKAFPIYMFPSIIRELHHLFSYDLIKHNVETYFPGGKGVEKLVNLLKKYVPLVSAYHRGFMGMTGAGSPKEIIKKMVKLLQKFGGGETVVGKNFINKPLSEVLVDGEYKDIVLKATALLRFVDGCDVQSDRTVDEVYRKARTRRTRYESELLWNQYSSVKQRLNDEFSEPLERFYNCATELMDGGTECNIEEIKSLQKEIESKVIDSLLGLSDDDCTPPYSEKLNALSLIDRLVFKLVQYFHFEKHSSISAVFPVRDGNDVKVVLVGEENNDRFEEIKGDIEGEWEKVKDILGGMGLKIKGVERHSV